MIPAKRTVLLACVAGCSCGAQTSSPVPLPTNSNGFNTNYHLNVLTRPTLDDMIVVLRLAPNIATSVWLPEPVNSVVVGFPECFAEEHSEDESRLVTLRPKRDKAACESNVQITTVSGKHALLEIESLGAATPANQAVDVLLQYATQAPGNFLEERSAPTLFVGRCHVAAQKMSYRAGGVLSARAPRGNAIRNRCQAAMTCCHVSNRFCLSAW